MIEIDMLIPQIINLLILKEISNESICIVDIWYYINKFIVLVV